MNISLSRKLLLPALLAVAIAPLALSATAGPQGEGRPAGYEQYQEQREAKRQALFERAGLDEATREALEEAHNEHRQAMREMHREHRERLDGILDEEQREALAEARREMREEHRSEWRESRRAAMQERLEALVDGWELSDEEREALREARESIYADLEALRGRDFDSREERRAAMREMREKHQASLAELLSDEQLEELKAALKPHGGKAHGKRHGHYHHDHHWGDDKHAEKDEDRND